MKSPWNSKGQEENGVTDGKISSQGLEAEKKKFFS
jgi:hypothetical protein